MKNKKPRPIKKYNVIAQHAGEDYEIKVEAKSGDEALHLAVGKMRSNDDDLVFYEEDEF